MYMNPNFQNQHVLSGTVETQIFPGAGVSPRQLYIDKQNLEKNIETIEPPKEYGYIFTKNYLIGTSFLVATAIFVFGAIILVELTGYASR